MMKPGKLIETYEHVWRFQRTVSANRFAVVARWLKSFACGVKQWWAIMAGALSIPFALLAFFNVSERLRFATLAYVSLWVLTISQARRISQLEKPPPHKLMVSPSCRIND